MENGIAIFSGRFDPPNLGHILTIGWLLNRYDRVIIPILDYPEREINSGIALDIFITLFELLFCNKERLHITINKTHFGKITEDEIRVMCWNCTRISDMSKFVYVGGNKEVNDHISNLDFIKVKYMPRISLLKNGLIKDQYLFESTKIRERIKKGESIESQYNIKV